MHYYARTGRQEALDHTELSLTKMAQGGIYDQLGGGFARYSTDAEWKVPHFEKMLYDNGQLLSVYAEAYQLTHKPLYHNVVDETVQFLEREMQSPEGGFYAALDADSEGEEGKFYTWTSEEIDNNLTDPDIRALIKAHYGIDKAGAWENGKNILLIAKDPATLAYENEGDEDAIQAQLEKGKAQLFQQRAKRTRPGLDDKVLTAWNALVIKGLSDAFRVFQKPHYLTLAQTNVSFILDNMMEGNTLYRSYKNVHTKITAFLDDYALLIQALIHFYQATFEEKMLNRALTLTETVFEQFFDEKTGMFQYKGHDQPQLITQKFEIADNVIASPNSVMAKNLFYLSHYFDRSAFRERATTMLQTIHEQWQKQPYFFSNWGTLACHLTSHFYEVGITGEQAYEISRQIQHPYKPHKIVAATTHENTTLPLLQNRFAQNKTLIYVCRDKACQQPVTSAEEALAQMKE